MRARVSFVCVCVYVCVRACARTIYCSQLTLLKNLDLGIAVLFRTFTYCLVLMRTVLPFHQVPLNGRLLLSKMAIW